MFNEDWYVDSQLKLLVSAYSQVKNLEGAVIEIGCWEGKSTCALANACYPEILHAVDNWIGSVSENPNHASVKIAESRDVFKVFADNIRDKTKNNVTPYKQDCFTFLDKLDYDVKFCHIDAAHDYESVRKTIEILKPFVVPGGILCGDDYTSANIHRKDLNGGVQRAVIELLPGHGLDGNFWFWKNN